MSNKKGKMKTKRPENETPEERFRRVAETRTNSILKYLRLLGNLSNRRLYKYSQQDVNKIFRTINYQVKEARARFNTGKKEKFTL